MIALLLLLALNIHASEIPTGKRARAIIDLGSGTTKLSLSEVQFTPDGSRIINEWPEGLSVPLPLEASKTPDGSIPPELVNAALINLRGLRERALNSAKKHGYKEIQITVVGTHALRTAKNRDEVVAKLTREGFPTRAITQAEEARAGFNGALVKGLPEKCVADSVVVWDVGGGSMQLTRAKGDPEFIGLEIGAEAFREKALKLHNRPAPDPTCGANPESPNPIGKNNLAALKKMAIQMATEPFKNQKMWPVSCVIGIGGIHTKAIESQISSNWDKIKTCVCGKKECSHEPGTYTRRELDCLSQNFAQKSDCDPTIKGAYAKTSVSNLLFILGFMEKWNIAKVTTRSVNMGPAFAMERSNLNYGNLEVP